MNKFTGNVQQTFTQTRFGKQVQTQTATAGLSTFGFGYQRKQAGKAVVYQPLSVVLSAIGTTWRQMYGRFYSGKVGLFLKDR